MGKEGVQWAWVFVVALPPRFLCRNARAADDRGRRDYSSAAVSRDFSQRPGLALVGLFGVVATCR